MAKLFDLIIFDCDGVLVDSEMLSAGVLMAMMAEVELPITPEIFRSDFLGRSFASAAAQAEKRFNRKLPENFQRHYRERLLGEMAVSLRPMAGVTEVLDALCVPYCLATSSSIPRLALSLEVTGLAPYFEGRSFTASEVVNGKPAPDLCLHVARQMATDPARCLVIEDSEMGVRAAHSAGMAVWLFTGGAHAKEGYSLSSDVVAGRTVASMAELKQVFAHLGLCRAAACL